MDLTARRDSYIEKLHANYTWAPLEEDEPIAALYSPQINAAAQELLVAAQREAAGPVRSARAKLDRLGVTDDQVQAMLDSGEVPRTYQLRSPVTGVLNELQGYEGHWLAEGEHLATTTDRSSLWLQLEAYGTDLH